MYQKVLKFAIPLFGVGTGYLASKFASNKVADMYPEKKEIWKSATSAVVTGGTIFGMSKAPKNAQPFLMGAALGAGTNTIVNIVSIPAINDKIPAQIKTLLAGDDELVENAKANYAKLYDEYHDLQNKFEQISNKSNNAKLAGAIEETVEKQLQQIDYQPERQLEGYAVGGDEDMDLEGDVVGDDDDMDLEGDSLGLDEYEELFRNS